MIYFGICPSIFGLILRLVVLTLIVLSSRVVSPNNGATYKPDTKSTWMEKTLISRLLEDYDRRSRPTVDNLTKLYVIKENNISIQQITVEFGLSLIQIMKLDEMEQILTSNVRTLYRWTDYHLRWDTKQYENITHVHIPTNKIWLPDISIYNYADERMEERRDCDAVVKYDGTVEWHPMAIFKSTCSVRIKYFPFDRQCCKLKFGPWSYDGFRVNITFYDNKTELDHSNLILNAEWVLLTTHAKFTVVRYVCCIEPFPDISFHILVKRNSAFYNYILILPCFLLSSLTLVLFWLPAESPAKMVLGMNIFIAFFLLVVLLEKSIPSASSAFPMIGTYYCVNMTLITLSTFLCLIIVNFHFRGDNRKEAPYWLKQLTIKHGARIMMVDLGPIMKKPLVPEINPTKRSSKPQNLSSQLLSTMTSSTSPPPLQYGEFPASHSYNQSTVAGQSMIGRSDNPYVIGSNIIESMPHPQPLMTQPYSHPPSRFYSQQHHQPQHQQQQQQHHHHPNKQTKYLLNQHHQLSYVQAPCHSYPSKNRYPSNHSRNTNNIVMTANINNYPYNNNIREDSPPDRIGMPRYDRDTPHTENSSCSCSSNCSNNSRHHYGCDDDVDPDQHHHRNHNGTMMIANNHDNEDTDDDDDEFDNQQIEADLNQFHPRQTNSTMFQQRHLQGQFRNYEEDLEEFLAECIQSPAIPITMANNQPQYYGTNNNNTNANPLLGASWASYNSATSQKPLSKHSSILQHQTTIATTPPPTATATTTTMNNYRDLNVRNMSHHSNTNTNSIFVARRVNLITKDINDVIKDLAFIQKNNENREKVNRIVSEWRAVGMVLDRFFFMLYMIAIILSLILFFPKAGEDPYYDKDGNLDCDVGIR